MCRQISKQFEFLVCLNKFDLLALVKDELTLSGLASELDHLSKFQVISALSQERVSPYAQLKAVQPPYVIVRFPPSFSVSQVLRVVEFGPIDTHQTFPNTCTVLIRYRHAASATFSYGAFMPCNFLFTSESSSAFCFRFWLPDLVSIVDADLSNFLSIAAEWLRSMQSCLIRFLLVCY